MRRALDAVSSVHGTGDVELPAGIPADEVPGHLGVFRHPAGELSIGLGVESRRPEMMTAHEIGHFVAWSGLPGDGYDSFKAPVEPLLKELMSRIRASAAYRELARLPPETRGRMRRSPEAFARAYAQWIAWRSGDRAMRQQVDRALASEVPAHILLQWDYEDFLPIAEAMDDLFEGMGWLTRE